MTGGVDVGNVSMNVDHSSKRGHGRLFIVNDNYRSNQRSCCGLDNEVSHCSTLVLHTGPHRRAGQTIGNGSSRSSRESTRVNMGCSDMVKLEKEKVDLGMVWVFIAIVALYGFSKMYVPFALVT